jgi:hypothetical protein
VKQVLRFVAQCLLYVPLMALLGTFSTQPRFQVMAEDKALVRISLTHAGSLLVECRQRSPEELAKLAPNMRAQQVCPRERSPIRVEVHLDDALLLDATAPPSGLRRDGASTIYRRTEVPAGRYRLRARLADGPSGAYTHERAIDVDLRPGGSLLIDFNAAKGGFLFRD